MADDLQVTQEETHVLWRESPTLARLVPIAWARERVPNVPGLWPDDVVLPWATAHVVEQVAYDGYMQEDGWFRIDQEPTIAKLPVLLGIVRVIRVTPGPFGGMTLCEPGYMRAVFRTMDDKVILAPAVKGEADS